MELKQFSTINHTTISALDVRKWVLERKKLHKRSEQKKHNKKILLGSVKFIIINLQLMYSSFKTPPRSVPRVQVIAGIQKFRTSTSPIISSQNRKVLEAKIKIENQSTIAATQRTINDRMYINTDRNPFSSVKGNIKNNRRERFSTQVGVYSPNSNLDTNKISSLQKPLRGKKSSNVVKQKNILEEINALRAGKKANYTGKDKRSQKIYQIISQSQNLSNKFRNKIQSEKYRIEKSKNQNVEEIIKESKNQSFMKIQDFERDIQQIEIQQIVAIKEPNFYFNEGKRKINIFKCPYDSEENMSPYEQLQQRNFSFQALIEKIGKIRISTLKEISKLSRKMICGEKIFEKDLMDVLQSDELSLKQNHLTYVGVMSFASGRISTEFVGRISMDILTGRHANNKGSDASSQQGEQDLIPQRQNTAQHGDKFDGDNEQRDEIRQFTLLKLTHEQKTYREECKLLKQKIGTLLNQKSNIFQNRIQDENIHNEHLKNLEELFYGYISKKNHENINDTDIKVRRNKIFKDRTESYMLKQMIHAMKFKNQTDRLLENGFQIQMLSIEDQDTKRNSLNNSLFKKKKK